MNKVKKAMLVATGEDVPFDSPSLEALSFQGKDYFESLAKTVGSLRTELISGGKVAAAIQKLEASVKKETGVNITFHVIDNNIPAAWVMIPTIDIRHPLYSLSVAGVTAEQIQEEAMGGEIVSKGLEGKINTKTGKVSGTYSDIPFKIYVSFGIMTNIKFEDDEVAAVILHEVGHCYSMLYALGYNYNSNYALAAAQKAIAGTDDSEIISKILIATAKNQPRLKKELDSVSKVEGKKVQQQILIGIHQREVMSYNDSPLYDRRSAEHFSDFYVGRYGGSLALASSLDKLYRIYRVDLKETSSAYFVSTALGFLAAVTFLPITIAAMAITLLVDDTNPRHVYDSSRNRLAAIKRQSVERLKWVDRSNVSNESKQQLVDEYKAIEAIEEQYRDYRLFFEWFADSVLNRKQVKVSDTQRTLEKLNANPIFVRAAQLEGLS